jgi:hypothetical protein
MKISKIYLTIMLLLSLNTNAQISKRNWMVGGGASFAHNKITSGGSTNESNSVRIYPNLGYFVIDKLAIGSFAQFGTETKTDAVFGIGPFVRYYFLEKEKPFNILTEISYNLVRYNQSDLKYNTLNIKAGAVYFLNSSVGLEATLNYSNQKSNFDYQNNSIYLGFGFQIHLEREK